MMVLFLAAVFLNLTVILCWLCSWQRSCQTFAAFPARFVPGSGRVKPESNFLLLLFLAAVFQHFDPNFLLVSFLAAVCWLVP